MKQVVMFLVCKTSKIYTLPRQTQDIELINISIRILHANFKMSVPKIWDVCHIEYATDPQTPCLWVTKSAIVVSK